MAKTPKAHNKTILKKSVFTFNKVPEKNIAGMNAKIYPNPYSKRQLTPPPNANIGKNIPNIIYPQTESIPNFLPNRANIKKTVGICGIYL